MDFAKALTYTPLNSLPPTAIESITHQIYQIQVQCPQAPSIATSGQIVQCAIDSTSSDLVGYVVYRFVARPKKGKTKKHARYINLQWIFVLPAFRNQKVGRVLLSSLHPIAEKEKCEVIKAWFPMEIEDEEYEEQGNRGKARKWMMRHGYDRTVADIEHYGSDEGEMVFHAIGMYD